MPNAACLCIACCGPCLGPRLGASPQPAALVKQLCMRPMSFPLAVLSFVAAGACFLDFSLLQKLEQEASPLSMGCNGARAPASRQPQCMRATATACVRAAKRSAS